MKKKTMKRIVAGCLLVGLLSAIGIGAYLTDTEVKEDVYTVGNVQAEIVANGDIEVENVGYVLPNTLHQYERAATNTGVNDAYVFMSITLPLEYISRPWPGGANDDTRVLGQFHCPFSAEDPYNPNGSTSSEWQVVEVGKYGQYDILPVGQHANDFYACIVGKTITYIYGYVGDNTDGSLKVLAPGETTANLLDQIAIINICGIDNPTGEISTKLYAIQANNINGGLTDVDDVWAVINTALIGEIEMACPHVFVEDCVCQACGEETHKSIELLLPAGDATCTTIGSDVDLYVCYDCENFFFNADGIGAMTEDEVLAYEGLIMPTGHNMVNSEYSQYCTKCGYEGMSGSATPDREHDLNENCVCNDCGAVRHNFSGDDDNCTRCGVGHTHEMRFIPAREASSCRNDGYAFDAYKCTICNKLYTDENGENRVNREDWIIVVNHNYVNGENYKYCTNCGQSIHYGDGGQNTPVVEPFDASKVEWRFFDTDWEKNTVHGGQPEGEKFIHAYIQNLMMSGDTATFTVGYTNYNDVDAVVTALIENSNPEYFSVELDNDIIIPAHGEGVFTVTVTLIQTPIGEVVCELIINIEAVEAN